MMIDGPSEGRRESRAERYAMWFLWTYYLALPAAALVAFIVIVSTR